MSHLNLVVCTGTRLTFHSCCSIAEGDVSLCQFLRSSSNKHTYMLASRCNAWSRFVSVCMFACVFVHILMHACMLLCAYMTCCDPAGRGTAGGCAHEAKVGPRGPGTRLLCSIIKFVSTEHVCVCVCVCVCVRARARICVYMYVCMCVYMYVCMYVCVYGCIWMYMDVYGCIWMVCTVTYLFVRTCILL
jgi:hypothetical protein